MFARKTGKSVFCNRPPQTGGRGNPAPTILSNVPGKLQGAASPTPHRITQHSGRGTSGGRPLQFSRKALESFVGGGVLDAPAGSPRPPVFQNVVQEPRARNARPYKLPAMFDSNVGAGSPGPHPKPEYLGKAGGTGNPSPTKYLERPIRM